MVTKTKLLNRGVAVASSMMMTVGFTVAAPTFVLNQPITASAAQDTNTGDHTGATGHNTNDPHKLFGDLLTPRWTNADTSYEASRKASARFGKPLEAAPKGFDLSYVTLFGRHGARGSSSMSHANNVMKVLRAAKNENKLNAEGEKLLRYIDTVYRSGQESARGNGNLSTLGHKEWHDIAARSKERLGDLYQSGNDAKKIIDVYSSKKQRAIDSGQEFIDTLKSDYPQLFPAAPTQDVNKTIADSDMSDAQRDQYLKQDAEYLKAKRWQKHSPGVGLDYVSAAKELFRPFIGDFVDDPQFNRVGSLSGYCGGVARDIVELHAMDQNLSLDEQPAGELRPGDFPELDRDASMMIGRCRAIDEWYKRGRGFAQTADGQPQLFSFRAGLKPLAKFFSAIDDPGNTVGTLIFSHNEILTPLNAVMGIPEIGANETAKHGQVYNFEDFKFNEAESDPMAGNIEWDLFTNADGLKLVRMQHNEMPATFGWDCQPIKPGSHFYLYHELKRCLPDAGQKPVADEVLNSERQAITAVLAANDTAEKLAAAQVELAELKNKFQTEQVRTADLQKQLNAATVQTNTVKKQLEAAQAKAVKDLEQARKEADAAKQAALDAANKEHKAAAQVAAKKLADAQSRLDEAENQLAAANQAAQEAAEQHAVAIKVLEQKIKNAEAQRVVLQKQLTAVIGQKNAETAKNEALMQERDKVKQLALGLENQLKAGKLELTKLKSTATAAQQAADKKIAELQARLDELQAQLDTAKQDIALKLNGNKADGSRVPEVSQPEMVQSAEGKTAIKDQQSPGDAHQHNIVKGESKVNIQGESKVKSAKQTAANADYNQVNTVKTLSKTGASEIITLGGVAMLILLAGVAVAATYRRLR